MGNGEEVVCIPLRMQSVSMDCLPDELLVKILSLLITKEAVSTSVLSKRWRTLFASCPNLEFNDNTFWLSEEVILERGDEIQEEFRSFVDRVLDLQGVVPTQKFSLTCGSEHEEVHVNRWIDNALALGVPEVNLSFYDYMQRVLPTSLFNSKTIVKLSLGTQLRFDYILSKDSFPVLKVLLFDSVWFRSPWFFTMFLDACPVLEDLTINHKYFPGAPYDISNKTIKKLSITYECALWIHLYTSISLDTPNLVELYYSDYALPQYLQCYLNSLAKATLDLKFLKYEDTQGQLVIPDVTGLICEIRNVKILDLSYSTIEVMSMCCSGLPVFKNLVGLMLSGREHSSWEILLPLLLERTPNLETLVLAGVDICPYEHESWTIRIPPSNQVKFLRILHYQGSANEVKQISHILLNMECLERVRVCVSSAMNDSEKMQIKEDLLKLPTASSNLTMEFN